MFQKIMVPVDLEHVDHVGKSLEIAARMAKDNDAALFYVAVSTKVPNMAAASPEKFNEALQQFADEQSRKFGLSIKAKGISSVDVSRELNKQLLKLADDLGIDLIVMASHVPSIADKLHLISSNAAYIAGHFKKSVFVVR